MDTRTTGGFLLLFVGFALVVSGVATGAIGSAATADQLSESSLVQINETSNYERVSDDDLERVGFAQVGTDVTAATQLDNDRMSARMVTESFYSQFQNSDTDADRTAAVHAAVRMLDAQSARVSERQAAALDQYNRNETTTRQYAVALVRGDTATRAIDSAATAVAAADDTIPGYEIRPDLADRLDSFDSRAHPASGPVRQNQLRAAVVGFDAPILVHVETSADTVVFAAVDDGQYVREMFDRTGVAVDSPPRFQITDIVDRISQLYPWAMNSSNPNQAIEFNTLWNRQAFSAQVPHTHGELMVSLDATTGAIFKESHTKSLDLPVTRTDTNSSEEFTLTVNGTYDTGPLEVSLVRQTTGEGVSAPVEIDGVPAGTTGSDGHLWTLDTRGVTSVRVTTPDGTPLTVEVPGERP